MIALEVLAAHIYSHPVALGLTDMAPAATALSPSVALVGCTCDLLLLHI